MPPACYFAGPVTPVIMFNKIAFIRLLACISVTGIIACSHYDELQQNGTVSSAAEQSHNAGEDCMRCHHDADNEASERWWNIAGTVYRPGGAFASAAGTVQLWTGLRGTGTLLCSLPIDRSGNFYTEKIIDLKGGYFPIVIAGSDTFAMSEKVTGTDQYKSCNNCHGHNGNGINTPVITLQ